MLILEIQRKLVVVDYPGCSPPQIAILHEYNKVFDGSISFVPSISEEDLRESISNLVQEKQFMGCWSRGL